MCQVIIKSYINVEVMAWRNPDGRTDARNHEQHTHIRQTEILTTMFRSPHAGSTKKSNTKIVVFAISVDEIKANTSFFLILQTYNL